MIGILLQLFCGFRHCKEVLQNASGSFSTSPTDM
jgi:hypothetical protein